MPCSETFYFKHFKVCQDDVLMKITTDAILLGTVIETANTHTGLDIGTGSGVIALIIAQRNPFILLDAIEPHYSSYQQANKNFKNAPFSDRLHVYPKRLQDFTPRKQYDLIISNPPFFDSSQTEKNNPARHTHFLSINNIFSFVSRYLQSQGTCSIIFPADKHNEVLESAYLHDLFPSKRIEIQDHPSAKIKRTVWSFVKNIHRKYEEKTLLLFDKNGTRTNEFHRLTKNFLLDE